MARWAWYGGLTLAGVSAALCVSSLWNWYAGWRLWGENRTTQMGDMTRVESVPSEGFGLGAYMGEFRFQLTPNPTSRVSSFGFGALPLRMWPEDRFFNTIPMGPGEIYFLIELPLWMPLLAGLGLAGLGWRARWRDASERAMGPRCEVCGYSLVGLKEGAGCPECGGKGK